MKEKKDFIKLLESYFQRDDSLVKQQYEEFIASEHAALLLKKLYESIPQIEKTFNHTLPQEYKNFIEADYAWGVYGKENDFRLYDVIEIYDFNYIGKHRGNSSIEEMKDYFIFGQNDGECSYFFDSFNKLGYGTETVWKINRSAVNDGIKWFDLIAENFYSFVEDYVNKKEQDQNYVFNPEWKKLSASTDNYIQYLENRCEELIGDKAGLKELLVLIKEYNEKMNKRYEVFRTKNFTNDECFDFVKNNENLFLNNKSLIYLLYVIIKEGDIFLRSNKVTLEFLSELLEKHNKFLAKKNMFAFYYNEKSLLTDDLLAWDLFFIDPTDKLGNGSNAIYVISSKSKKLEEACYVAKDIVDLFRIFAEGEELNTTPIGKIK